MYGHGRARAKATVLQLDHQRTGTKFLGENERAGLFDEQGLGKSKQLNSVHASDSPASSEREVKLLFGVAALTR